MRPPYAPTVSDVNIKTIDLRIYRIMSAAQSVQIVPTVRPDLPHRCVCGGLPGLCAVFFLSRMKESDHEF